MIRLDYNGLRGELLVLDDDDDVLNFEEGTGN